MSASVFTFVDIICTYMHLYMYVYFVIYGSKGKGCRSYKEINHFLSANVMHHYWNVTTPCIAHIYIYIHVFMKQIDVFSLLQHRQLFIHLHTYVFVCGRQYIVYVLMYVEHLYVLPAHIAYDTVSEGVNIYTFVMLSVYVET